MKRILVVCFALALMLLLLGATFAQDVDILDPNSWFTSMAAVITVASIITGYITKLITAIAKKSFETNGRVTVAISALVSVIIGGVGGWLQLGIFGESGGSINGMLQGALTILMTFIISNGSAIHDKQTANKTGAKVAEEVGKVLAKAHDPAATEAKVKTKGL